MGVNLNTDKVRSYFYAMVSCIFYTLAINLFIKPNHIVGGGVTGMALLIHTYFPWGIGLIAYLLNIPIMIMSFKMKNMGFTIKCLIVTTQLNFLIDAFAFLPAMTHRPLLGAIYGGIFLGISVGLNYRYDVSSGGTELLGQLLIIKLNHITIGKMLMIIDGSIVLIGSLILRNPQNILLALIMIVTSGKVSDMVIRLCAFIEGSHPSTIYKRKKSACNRMNKHVMHTKRKVKNEGMFGK
ncbi:YitT family protein [Vallitalea pronyensis]|uniref:YitT family protein n=1 Tax=Vallitalea pronyensis TaxID=1348613 RepID=A0A8J8MK24_9FIRM|nr:YitT family protein [Vallitalea pronyensis]QUI22876.1 YitT family protein [Vallitalea pronyensis]